ncbi:hypothetical protein FA13DRAFT_1807111 [Coprinellus micaceus]|uniref:Uncharacterized protein n=1 Tax=Coprinellus micaceus TaxID=71717 RepID=A0A4Y7RC39_COPMI|nr:hypothetical protein FA13DRAFT_1807111 [Coprinellus micaceus]
MIGPDISRSVFEATKRAAVAPNSIFNGKKTGNWRDDRSTYADPSKCTIPPGNANISVGWYARGQAAKKEHLMPSSILRQESGIAFLQETHVAAGIVGAMLSIIHPEVYEAHLLVLLEMHWMRNCLADPEFTKATEFHRDNKGGGMLPDVLSMYGSYQRGRLEIPLLGARFVYNPGTNIVFPGYMMEHGASKMDGERVCIASFLRLNVGASLLDDEEMNPYREADLGPASADYLSKKHNWGDAKERVDIW